MDAQKVWLQQQEQSRRAAQTEAVLSELRVLPRVRSGPESATLVKPREDDTGIKHHGHRGPLRPGCGVGATGSQESVRPSYVDGISDRTSNSSSTISPSTSSTSPPEVPSRVAHVPYMNDPGVLTPPRTWTSSSSTMMAPRRQPCRQATSKPIIRDEWHESWLPRQQQHGGHHSGLASRIRAQIRQMVSWRSQEFRSDSWVPPPRADIVGKTIHETIR